MTSNEYREQIRREIEKELGGRDASLRAVPAASPSESAREWLRTLGDQAQPAASRRAALEALQQLSFKANAFAAIRAEYIDALRSVIDDPDRQLREIALETLAQEKDEYAQRRLLAGLNREEAPLVEDSKAIQFLGYDIHADHFPTMRRLAENAPDVDTRREAVKVLAADTDSANLLYGIFDNRSEDDSVRRASASALLSVDPARFEERAKQVVLDASDAESVRAAALTALTYFANPTALADDPQFMNGVSNLRPPAPPSAALTTGLAPEPEGDLAKAVRMFTQRHGR
jgi:hypothetical protein